MSTATELPLPMSVGRVMLDLMRQTLVLASSVLVAVVITVGATNFRDHRWSIASTPIFQLVRGVGQVCISASMLEWALTCLTGMIENWDDDKHRELVGHPGRALNTYRALVPRLEALGLGPDVAHLADDAQRLLAERHRVVHSVMMTANESRYEAWHPRRDITWAADPAALHPLALDLTLCMAEVTAFAGAWKERSERDGWPILS